VRSPVAPVLPVHVKADGGTTGGGGPPSSPVAVLEPPLPGTYPLDASGASGAGRGGDAVVFPCTPSPQPAASATTKSATLHDEMPPGVMTHGLLHPRGK
jgi:hypothetical protein